LSEEQKQPHLLLDLAESLPQYSFVLVGPADDDEYHQQILDRVKRLKNVRYDGPVNPEEIYKYYEEAVALVNTSAFEGFPNTFLEAWRVATPVISLNVPHSRLIENANEFGYANGDPVKMKEIANRLAEDEELRCLIGLSNQQSMEENLEISEVASQYKDAIESTTN
jgi:glycosyltransferase involved in cell wall biosynthesis